MKSSFRLLCSAALVVVLGTTSAHAADAACVVGDKFQSAAGLACKFAVTVTEFDTTGPSRDLFNLPTTVIVTAFEYAVPGYGYVVGQSFRKEGERSYVADIKPPPQFSHYLHCQHGLEFTSSNRAVNYDKWRSVTASGGTYSWGLRAPKLFGGRAWHKGKLIWKAVHPEYRSTAIKNGECDASP